MRCVTGFELSPINNLIKYAFIALNLLALGAVVGSSFLGVRLQVGAIVAALSLAAIAVAAKSVFRMRRHLRCSVLKLEQPKPCNFVSWISARYR